jgi:hypothetical protein
MSPDRLAAIARRAALAGAALVAALVPTRAAVAQLPNAPVLQNAWAAPGIVVAANLAGGSEGSVYAGAAAWAPASARFQVSAGAGMQARQDRGSRFVYGGRVSVPVWSPGSGAIGIGAFAGIGGGAGGSSRSATDPIAVDSTSESLVIPVGAAIGYRRGFGGIRGFSAYATPAYVMVRGNGTSNNLLRVGLGLDVGISAAFGVTIGAETGQAASEGSPGPTGVLYGLGISYALGRR